MRNNSFPMRILISEATKLLLETPETYSMAYRGELEFQVNVSS